MSVYKCEQETEDIKRTADIESGKQEQKQLEEEERRKKEENDENQRFRK